MKLNAKTRVYRINVGIVTFIFRVQIAISSSLIAASSNMQETNFQFAHAYAVPTFNVQNYKVNMESHNHKTQTLKGPKEDKGNGKEIDAFVESNPIYQRRISN